MRSIGSSLFVLLVALGTGCPATEDGSLSGGGSGGAAGDPADGAGAESDQEELRRLAEALCEHQSACGCGADSDADPADCAVEHYEGLLAVAEIAQDAEGYAYDGGCLRQLADCWATLGCDEPWDACALDCGAHGLNLERDAACDQDRWQLGPRAYVQQCEPGLSCLGGHGYAVCDVDAPLQEGEPCSDGGSHLWCDEDLYCAYEDGGGGGTCVPRLGEGEACDARPACERELRCVDGLCTVRLEVGAACEDTDECSLGAACHPETSTCESSPALGEACRFGDEVFPCAEGRCGSERCEPWEISTCNAIPSITSYPV